MIDETQQPTKICSKCGREKSLKDGFYKSKDRKDGYDVNCKECRANSRAINWVSLLLRDSRTRSKNKNQPFNITKEYILKLFEKQKGKCYWFDIPMIPSLSPSDPAQPTIDRLESKLGYVKGNVVLSCFAANIGRNITSAKRFREFVSLIQQKKE